MLGLTKKTDLAATSEAGHWSNAAQPDGGSEVDDQPEYTSLEAVWGETGGLGKTLAFEGGNAYLVTEQAAGVEPLDAQATQHTRSLSCRH